MRERDFSETELRTMVEDAIAIVEQDHGTYIVATAHDGDPWEIIVCPDEARQRIVVVTGYKES